MRDDGNNAKPSFLLCLLRQCRSTSRTLECTEDLYSIYDSWYPAISRRAATPRTAAMHQCRTFLGQSRFPALLLVAKLRQLVSWPLSLSLSLPIQSIYHDLSNCDLFIHRSIYLPSRSPLSIHLSLIRLTRYASALFFLIWGILA